VSKPEGEREMMRGERGNGKREVLLPYFLDLFSTLADR